MKRLLIGTVAWAVLAGGALAQTPDASLRASIQADYDDHLGSLFDWFHRNPELSGLEINTAARMANELRALGYQVTEGVGGTGVVAVLTNGDGPTVLMRADMDGLPVEERSGLANASTVRQVDRDGQERPVMHACGHDVHITALVGAARQMIERRDQWAGTLVLVVQPAEERIFGAREMLEDGLYERFPRPDYAVAFHVAAGQPMGTISVPLDVVSSSSDSVDIQVRGVGTHGAYPHLGVDPVLVASQIVVSLQSIVSREISPLEGAVITVGSIHGGTKHNIIGERVDLQLTVRSDSPEVRERLLDGIDRVSANTARALGVPEDRLPIVVRSATETTPATINDPETAQRVRDAIVAGMGADRLVESPRTGMGAEDFAYFAAPGNGVRGVYFHVGGTLPSEVETVAGHHSPEFRIEAEPSVTAGVEAMVLAGMALMAPP